MGEKETMSGDALRESPTRGSTVGKPSGRMENIGSSGMDTGPDASAAPNLGSSGQERSSMSGEAGRVAPADLDGDGLPDIDAAAAKKGNYNLGENKPL